MSIGRRAVSLGDTTSWVFNRMVDAYEARPAYPDALIDEVCGAVPAQSRALDVGAGLGHLALPLAQTGLRVAALEPAVHMLQRLQSKAQATHVDLELVHGQAELLPFADKMFDLVLLADALHFLDSERAAREMARVLADKGTLAVVVCEFAPTPFMTELRTIMESAAPRRPRNVEQSLTELFAVSGLRLPSPVCWVQELEVDEATLYGILGSISFIGPAMNATRAAAFRERVNAIPHPRRWARRVCLYMARR